MRLQNESNVNLGLLGAFLRILNHPRQEEQSRMYLCLTQSAGTSSSGRTTPLRKPPGNPDTTSPTSASTSTSLIKIMTSTKAPSPRPRKIGPRKRSPKQKRRSPKQRRRNPKQRIRNPKLRHSPRITKLRPRKAKEASLRQKRSRENLGL